jgi:hypothetical protein
LPIAALSYAAGPFHLWDFYIFPPPPLSNLYAGREHIRRETRSLIVVVYPAGGTSFQGSASDRMPVPNIGKEQENMDIIMVAIGAVFFALCLGYIKACEKL